MVWRWLAVFIWAAGLALGAGAALAADSPQVPATRPASGPKPTTVTEPCANDTCHANLINRKVMHGPTAQKKCLACHQAVEPRDHHFKLTNQPDKLCADCHALKHRTVVHTPVAQGRCTGCHDPHGSDYRAILIADPTRGLCLTCHQQDAFAKKKFIHGPVAAGACIVCHEPHSAWQPKLLVQPADKLCLTCHSEMLPKGDDARHVHAPVKENCGLCHDAHASDHKAQLRQAAPDLCLSCHKDVAKALASSPVVHGAALQADGCTGCHTPHFSQLPKLQKTTQPQLCLSCHDRPLQTPDKKMLTNMAALLKENPQHHGPIREGDCSACHQPHAGERFRLLAADYPPEFYATFNLENYKLCFNCHIPDLVLKKQGVGLTNFRNGEVNLHYMHVNQEKGRTCRACHEVHASQHPFHIRDAVPFGSKGWMLEIHYEQTPTGGSCAPGCHTPKTYDHGGAPRPVIVPATQPSKEPLHASLVR